MSDSGKKDARRQTPDAIREAHVTKGDSITIAGIEAFGFHGVLAKEKEDGQRFLIDVELSLDLSAAGASDRLSDTIDYGLIAQRIHDVVAEERWDLIERVATRVAESVLGDARIHSVEVTVHKPEAPITVGFADVAVTVRRNRD